MTGQVAVCCAFVEFIEHDNRFFIILVQREVTFCADIEPERRATMLSALLTRRNDAFTNICTLGLDFEFGEHGGHCEKQSRVGSELLGLRSVGPHIEDVETNAVLIHDTLNNG